MVSLLLKIILIAIGIVFLDMILQQAFTGAILVGEEEYTFLEIILLLLEFIAAFLIIIVHLITHFFDLNVWTQDISLMFNGIVSLLMWLIRSSISLIFHLITLPLVILFNFLPASGFYINLWFFGWILIDFKTLSFIVSIGNLDGANFFGVIVEIQNIIGFSLLGTPVGNGFFETYTPLWVLDITGSTGAELGNVYWFDLNEWANMDLSKFISLGIYLDDRVWTCPFNPLGDCLYASIPPSQLIPMPLKLPVLSLETTIDVIIDMMNIPTPREWIDGVYKAVAPELAGAGINATLFNQKVFNICQKENVIMV